MINISGFGLTVNVVASVTFPNGVSITAFADDADPLETGAVDLGDTGMGLNGDLGVWSRPQVYDLELNVFATTQDDKNLAAIFDANRIGKGKTSARDVINVVINYPNGEKVALNNGIMVTGTAFPPVSNQGRFKTRTYRFRFQDIAQAYT
jgi:hypothetical protein